MVTYKQLEALHWISQSGSFQRAADRLNTSQAAISKRIQELEHAYGVALFDRSGREARLTAKGQEILPVVETLLRQRQQFVDTLCQPEVLRARLRLGVTELTALTWLPALVARIRHQYPMVSVEPDVDLSAGLSEKLAQDRADVIVLPDAFAHPGCITTPLASVENAWFCKPGLLPNRRTFALAELASFPLLTQGSLSGSGVLHGRWLESNDMRIAQSVTSNSLLALAGLAISGLGLAAMPRHCVQGLFGKRLLSVVKTTPSLPSIAYVAVCRKNTRTRLIQDVMAMASQCCDFNIVIRHDGA
ncbi:MAG: hypothetical protein RLZZ401_940 [Pseudomonadota bacterium]|jgi:DNA-binding transcriptional LysR family regulator